MYIYQYLFLSVQKSISYQKLIGLYFLVLPTLVFLVGCHSTDFDYGVAPVVERSVSALPERGALKRSTNHYKYYTVRQGDTLYSIAWAFGKDYRYLAKINGLKSPYLLKKTQRLRLQSGKHLRLTARRHLRAIAPLKRQTNAAPPVRGCNSKKRYWCWPTTGRVLGHAAYHRVSSGGINIAGKRGAVVYASADGEVVYGGNGLRGYGNLLIVKHNSSLLSAYAYNDKLLVKLGAHVRAGQPIALMGISSQGRPMLHFEIRDHGRSVNPMGYLFQGK